MSLRPKKCENSDFLTGVQNSPVSRSLCRLPTLSEFPDASILTAVVTTLFRLSGHGPKIFFSGNRGTCFWTSLPFLSARRLPSHSTLFKTFVVLSFFFIVPSALFHHCYCCLSIANCCIVLYCSFVIYSISTEISPFIIDCIFRIVD